MHLNYASDWQDWVIPCVPGGLTDNIWSIQLQVQGYATQSGKKSCVFVCPSAETTYYKNVNGVDYYLTYGENTCLGNWNASGDPAIKNMRFSDLLKTKKSTQMTPLLADNPGDYVVVHVNNNPANDPFDQVAPPGSICARHRTGANFLYADGHAFKPPAPYTAPGTRVAFLDPDSVPNIYTKY